MENLQIIYSPKGEEMVVLPRKAYDYMQRIVEEDEDARDIREADRIIKSIKEGKTKLIPADIVYAIVLDRINPVKVWRQHRGLTVSALAKKAKLSRTTVSQMESGARKGTVAAYKALAKTLDAPLSSLLIETGAKTG